MTIPQITALPDAPTPQDAPEVFNDKSFRHVAAQSQFVTEANVLAGFVADAAQAAEGAGGSAAAANESAIAARDVAVSAKATTLEAQAQVVAVATQFGDVSGAIAAAEVARDQAGTAAAGAGDSEAAAVAAKALSQAAQAQAETAKTQAEAARDAATVNGKVYATTAAGLAATSGTGDANRYFSVPSPESAEFLILYLNNAGAAVEQKRYQNSIIGVDGAYNLVNPGAAVMVGGINSAGDWAAGLPYNSIAVRVDAGSSLVLNNTVNTYTGQYRAAFFSAMPPSAGTKVGSVPSGGLDTIKNNSGDTYLSPTVPVGAKYLVLNVKFNAEVIDWFAAEGRIYNSRPAFKGCAPRANDLPTFDKGVRSDLLSEEGADNLYSAVNNLADKYIAATWAVGTSSAAQAWRVAVVPVEEGGVYAVYFGPAFTSSNWQFGVFATGIRESNSLGAAGKIVFSDTLNTQVKTFVVPSGMGITHAFLNVKVGSDDHTATLIAQAGSTVPVIPLPYVPALASVGAKAVKDRLARTKIANLTRRTSSASRFVGQKMYHFGDSLTEGTQGGYVKYIADITQCVPMNYGSSGSRTGRLVARATDQLNRQEVGGPATNPDYSGVAAVTIMIGTNDIDSPGSLGSLADIPAQSLQSLPFTPAGGSLVSTPNEYWALFPNTYHGNLGLVIEYIKYRNANTLIYLISPPHNTVYDMPVIRNILESIAKFYSVRFIDAQNEAGLEKKQFLKYSYDGSHLNVLGNELFGKYVGHRIAHS